MTIKSGKESGKINGKISGKIKIQKIPENKNTRKNRKHGAKDQK